MLDILTTTAVSQQLAILVFLRQAHTGPVFSNWLCLSVCVCVSYHFSNVWYIYSPQTSQIQAVEEASTGQCVAVIT